MLVFVFLVAVIVLVLLVLTFSPPSLSFFLCLSASLFFSLLKKKNYSLLQWPGGKASAMRAADLGLLHAFSLGLFPGWVIPLT